jgi:CsoR family transcriptional regulator, copper-sensing transcriptional repressor
MGDLEVPLAKATRHDSQQDSLARIEGQVRGIRSMVDEGRYCMDILTQCRAVHAALRRVERDILEAHLEGCVRTAFHSDDKRERAQKVEEILQLFDWDHAKATR